MDFLRTSGPSSGTWWGSRWGCVAAVACGNLELLPEEFGDVYRDLHHTHMGSDKYLVSFGSDYSCFSGAVIRRGPSKSLDDHTLRCQAANHHQYFRTVFLGLFFRSRICRGSLPPPPPPPLQFVAGAVAANSAALYLVPPVFLARPLCCCNASRMYLSHGGYQPSRTMYVSQGGYSSSSSKSRVPLGIVHSSVPVFNDPAYDLAAEQYRQVCGCCCLAGRHV